MKILAGLAVNAAQEVSEIRDQIPSRSQRGKKKRRNTKRHGTTLIWCEQVQRPNGTRVLVERVRLENADEVPGLVTAG